MHHRNDISLGFSVGPVVDALALPAVFVGLDHRIVRANGLAADVLQSGKIDTLEGKALGDLIDPGEPERYDSGLRLLERAGGQDNAVTIVLRSASGPCTFTVAPIHDGKAALLGYLLQSVSQTVQRVPAIESDDGEGEFSLAETEWRWKTAVLSANQAVWDHDFEHDRHYVSRTWKELRGLGPDDPFQTNTSEWLKTIHPRDLEQLKEELHRLESGVTDDIHYQFRQKHKDGRWIWFLSKGRVVQRDTDGFPARIIGTDTDITTIKCVELESSRMAERLELAKEAAGMGQWEYEIGASGAFWDDRLLKMYGLPRGNNFVARDVWIAALHPDDRDRVVRLTDQWIKNRQDILIDYRLLLRDGSVRYLRTSAKFVTEREGSARYYGVKIDLTSDFERSAELENARARLEHESRHDALTGLANRRFLDDAFNNISVTSDPPQVPAVMHFDIDHFKHINDTLGHDAGDATLRHAARILKGTLPVGTVVSRVGGDEFVALLPDAPPKAHMIEIADNIISCMSEPFHYGARQCNIGTSIGIAIHRINDPLDNSLFLNADMALYAAKKAGRGRSRIFNTAMKKEARRRKNAFEALISGFDQGEITCFYQPQFDAATLELTGLEALARWDSAEFGLMMPDEFLSTAEDMGLLAQFDDVVLGKSLKDMKSWEKKGLFVPGVSVNVSAHRLNDPKLASRIRQLDFPAGKLSFELLESAFLDSKNEVIEDNLKMIEELGIDVEIDDFGSGHASIVSLLEIAPKRLKIDRSLVQPIVNSERQRKLVSTIIGIGEMLEIRVVAEGVESAQHATILRDMGCCFLQGFGLARPMDAVKTSAFLREIGATGGRLISFQE